MTQPVRTATARLRADTGQYKRELRDARAVTADLAKEIDRLGALATQKAADQAKAAHDTKVAYQQNAAAAGQLGRGLLIAGAGIAAGIGLATRAAIQWQSAWTGVVKTVDGSEQQLAMLEEQLRGMARELPATHGEIAAVAEAAGQLGVATEDIASFTETMIALGTATNLTSDEAATAIAQLMNVMGTAPDQVDNLASALVELGNNGASTERQIIAMAQRIAGAGAIVGATEADVLALANALASAGIEVEAGGSAISRVLVSIDQAVAESGEKLEGFAQVAGVSADEFAAHFSRDPVSALNLFVLGLGRMNTAGENVFGTLDRLELSEIRTRDALLRLAASGDLLTQSLADGERAWDENIALAEEAERRYGTTAAQLQIARNQLNDLAISMGQTFLPVAGQVAGTIGAIADTVGELPGPARSAITVVAAVTAGLTLVGGAALIAVPKIVAFRAALDTLQASGGRAGAAVGLFRRVVGAVPLGPLSIALGAATVALGIFAVKQAETRQRIEEVSETLDQQTGAVTGNTRAWVAHELEQRGVLQSAQALGLDLATVTDAILGERNALDAVNRAVAEHDQQLGTIDPAVQAFSDQLKEQGVEGLELARRTAEYRVELERMNKASDTVKDTVNGLTGDVNAAAEATRREAEASDEAAAEMEALDPVTRGLAESLGLSADEANRASDEIDQLDQELKELFESVFGLQNAEDELAAQFARVTEQVQRQREAGDENAGSLRGQSEAARENRQAAQDLLEAYGALALETLRTTGSQEEAEQVAKDFEDALDDLERQTGINVRRLSGYNEVVDEIERLIDVHFETSGLGAARRAAESLQRQLDNIDRFVEINIRVNGPQPGVGGLRGAFQHGGEVPGSGAPDSVLAKVSPGEIIIRRDVAQSNRDWLLAFNRTGQLPADGLPVPAFNRGGLATAARELLARIKAGGNVFEDLSFRGMSANLRRFNDQLADMFYGRGGSNRQDLAGFLRGLADTQQQSSGVGGRFQWRGARVAGDGAAAVAPAVDQAALAHLVAREVGRAIDGATLVVDDRGMGRLEAKQADYYRRGG